MYLRNFWKVSAAYTKFFFVNERFCFPKYRIRIKILKLNEPFGN